MIIHPVRCDREIGDAIAIHTLADAHAGIPMI